MRTERAGVVADEITTVPSAKIVAKEVEELSKIRWVVTGVSVRTAEGSSAKTGT